MMVAGNCAGRCGASIAYRIEEFVAAAPCAGPVPSSRVAYKGGHLCPECEQVVDAALDMRRMDLARNKRKEQSRG